MLRGGQPLTIEQGFRGRCSLTGFGVSPISILFGGGKKASATALFYLLFPLLFVKKYGIMTVH